MQLSQCTKFAWQNLRSRVSAVVLVGLVAIVPTHRSRRAKKLWSDRRGATYIEYLILVGLLALGLLGAFRAFNASVDNTSNAEARAVVSLTWDGKTQKTSYSAPALSLDGFGTKTSEHSQKKECSGFWSCAWEKTKDIAGAVADYQHWPGWVKTTVTVVAGIAVAIAVGALVVMTAPAWLTGLALAAVVIIAGGIAAGAVGGGLNAAMTEGASVLDGIGKGAVLGFVGSAIFAAALPLELGALGVMAVGGAAGGLTYAADCLLFGAEWSTKDFLMSVAAGAILAGVFHWVGGNKSTGKGKSACEPPGKKNVTREDSRPYESEGKRPGTRKSHIDEGGNIQPADPEGKTTPTQHVDGSEPSKSSSPYTSFKEEPGVGKAFGDQTIQVDVARLKEDIASGRVKDVEIVEHRDLMKIHDDRVSAAQERYNNNPSPKNAERLERAQRDRANSARDSEMLIKGTIPSEYVTPPGGKPLGEGSRSPAMAPPFYYPSQGDNDD